MSESHYPAARDLTSSLGWMWDDLANRRGSWTDPDEDYFLLRLRETANYTIPGGVDPAVMRTHAQLLCSIFARLVRLALASGASGSALAAVETLIEVREYASSSPYQLAFEQAKGATLLTLLAWLLLKLPPEGAESQIGIANTLLSILEKRDTWPLLREALDDDFQHALGVTWWEMEGTSVRGVSGGVIAIDSYIRLAAVLSAGRRGTSSVPDPASEADGDLAWLLTESLKSLTKDAESRVSSLMPSESRMNSIESELKRAVEQRDRKQGDALARAELDPERVAAFHSGVANARSTRRNLLDLVAVTRTETPDKPSFGFNRLEQKWWFVNSHVSADPSRLAETLVQGLSRGEDSAIIDALRRESRARSVEIESLATSLLEWVSSREPLEGPVLVTNSWRVAEVLVGPKFDSLSDGAALKATVGALTMPVYNIYDGEQPFVAIFTANSLTVTLGLINDAESDAVVHDGTLLSLVRAPTEAEIAEWDTDHTRADQLRQQAVVAVLESLRIRVADPEQIGMWTLPESTY
jgi:hypothetical protein